MQPLPADLRLKVEILGRQTLQQRADRGEVRHRIALDTSDVLLAGLRGLSQPRHS